MRNRMLIWLLLGGGAFVLLVITILAVFVSAGNDDTAEFGFSDRIQVVDLHDESLIWLLPYREVQKAGIKFSMD